MLAVHATQLVYLKQHWQYARILRLLRLHPKRGTIDE